MIDFNIIRYDQVVGKNFSQGNFNMIGYGVTIGDNVTIKNYVEIRDNCHIGNNVKIGSRVTLAAGTIIGDNVDIKYGCVFTDTPKIGEKERDPCVVYEGCKFGANVTVMPGVTIFRDAMVGACSQVRHDVLEGETVYGNPIQR